MLTPLDTNEGMLAADFFEWRAAQTPFESMTAMSAGRRACELADGGAALLGCVLVDAAFLPMFGIQPVLGRNFAPDEDRPNAPKVALLSYGLWRNRFGGEPNIIGRVISLDQSRVTVIGVLPANFELPTLLSADLLVPLAIESFIGRPNRGVAVRGFGRLKPGINLEQAKAALQPLFATSLTLLPGFIEKDKVRLQIRSIRDRQTQEARTASWVLLTAVVAVLLIACANVANLMLSRITARQREFAVRAALGAGRWRLVRQILTESLLFSLLGGVAGSAFAWALLRLFLSLAPEGILRLEQASIDGRVLAFTFGTCVAAGLVFGLAPVLQVRSNISVRSPHAVGDRRPHFRHYLVAAQLAISLVLLASAGLLLRTLLHLQSIPLGIRTDHVMTVSLLRDPRGRPEVLTIIENLASRLKQLPGVADFAIGDAIPTSGGGTAIPYSSLEVEGQPKSPEGTGGFVLVRTVSPGYFATLRIPILSGRGLQESDRDPEEGVLVLSQSLARRLFRSENAIGEHVRPNNRTPWLTVVGVAANVKNNPTVTAADDPEYYLPLKYYADTLRLFPQVLIRTDRDFEQIAAWIRAEVAALDPTLPITISTMDQQVSRLSVRPRFNAALLGSFAGLGLLMAAIGLYGVMAFLVTQRTQEIGVRMALGATSRNIMTLVLRYALRFSLAGIMFGLAGSLFITRFLRTLLFEVPERDPWTLSLTVVSLFIVALVAAGIPARRAARIDPMAALRHD